MNMLLDLWSKSFDLNIGNISFPVSYLEAGAIVFLIFILIIMMAQFRRHYVDWSLKGGIAGIFFGFMLALILEGFLLIGGQTVITKVLGWQNAPKPISVALDSGRSKLIQVLGITNNAPASLVKESVGVQGAVQLLQSLNPQDQKKIKSLICTP
jgi:hypothetical protein